MTTKFYKTGNIILFWWVVASCVTQATVYFAGGKFLLGAILIPVSALVLFNVVCISIIGYKLFKAAKEISAAVKKSGISVSVIPVMFFPPAESLQLPVSEQIRKVLETEISRSATTTDKINFLIYHPSFSFLGPAIAAEYVYRIEEGEDCSALDNTYSQQKSGNKQ